MLSIINDMVICFVNVNGMGFVSVNNMFLKVIFRMGFLVLLKNIFLFNIQGLFIWYEVCINELGYFGCWVGIDILVVVNLQSF